MATKLVIIIVLLFPIAEQNEGLESLAQIISRQKEIARTIGSEAELHNGKF